MLGGCSKKGQTPIPAPGPGDTSTPVSNNGNKEVMIWVDLRSNVFGDYGRFSDTAKISAVLDTLTDVGVTSLIVDVKAASGYTIYPSAYTKQLTTMGGKTFPAGVDYLDFMVKGARKRKMKIYVSMMMFVEGDTDARLGNVFEDPTFKNTYQSIVCDANGNRVPIPQTGKSGFLNPTIPAVQDRIITIMKEAVLKYDIDGVIMDYGRYSDINADFSDFSKNDFIKFLQDKYGDNNAQYMNFPKDVVSSWTNDNGQAVPAATGPYFRRWLLYRVKTIYDFVKRASEEVRKAKPGVKFGSYVGAWYSTYYQLGVNWASKEYDPFNDQVLRFDWAYPGYNNYGYAECLDLLMTGDYFSQLMINDNPATVGMQYHWWSVEGALNGAKYITKGKVPLYGSIDMGNTSWNQKTDIRKAIQLILSKTSGIMLFDVVHVYAPQYNRLGVRLWDELKAGLKK
jgi:uncharacterized lipoprotein YddW (UPF0748 family)